jgi:Mor family transcriptional regulator
MADYTKQINDLRKIIELAEGAIAALGGSRSGAPRRRKKRRTPEEAKVFRAMLKSERDRGVSVYDLAKKHKVTMSYIYQIK